MGGFSVIPKFYDASKVRYSNAVSGLNSTLVQSALDELAYLNTIAREPTGFPNQTDSTIAFDDATRTFTISPVSASFEYLLAGITQTVSAPDSVVWTDAEGMHYFYYDSDGSGLKHTTTFDLTMITEHAFIAVLYWNAVDKDSDAYRGEERHGITMDSETHLLFHQALHTQWISGCGLTNLVIDGDGDSASHAQIAVNDGVIKDEDITISIVDGSPQDLYPLAQVPMLYMLGGADTWRIKAADDFPFIYNGTAGYTGTYPAYNEWTGSAWQLSDSGNNNYILVHGFLTNDVRHPVVTICPQAVHSTKAAARGAAVSEINSLVLSGMPFAEFTPAFTLIVKCSSTHSNTPKAAFVSTDDGDDYLIWLGSPLSPAGGISTSYHGDLSGLSEDHHLQYHTDARGDARYSQLSHTHDFDSLTDVTLSAEAKGSLAVYNGSAWVDIGVGSNNQVVTADSTAATGIKWATPASGSGSLSWVTKTGSYTATSGDALLADTSSSAFTITLPATPSAGDTVHLADYAGTWGDNSLTVARNGSKVLGEAEDLVCDCDLLCGSLRLTYVDATKGWIIT